MTRVTLILRAGPVILALAVPILSAEAPVAVSPGNTSNVAMVESLCPTFSWGEVEAAASYELVVYQLEDEKEETQPVLRQSFPGSVDSWTPSLDSCLQRGEQYAWSVRAVGPGELSDWSAPNLFEVASGLRDAELEEALEVVRRHFASRGQQNADQAAESLLGPGPDAKPRTVASNPSPIPAAVGTTQLSVDGGVVAMSFTGDGSTLTSLDPAQLSAGVAGISISGDADTVDGVHAAALEESAEISAHAADVDAHHDPGLQSYFLVTSPMRSGTVGGFTASCPSGTRVLGGGCSCDTASIERSYPSSTQWFCSCSTISYDPDKKAYVICTNR